MAHLYFFHHQEDSILSKIMSVLKFSTLAFPCWHMSACQFGHGDGIGTVP
jgi:hypothetical protein